MRKVLIITYYFPPINIIASKRYGRMALYMPKFGWEPVILTTNSEGNLPVLIPEENIIRIGENCDSKKVLVAEEGYRGIPKVLKPFYFLYKKLGMEIKSIDRFLFSWGKEIFKQKELIEKVNPDVIISTYLPAVSVWLGYIFSKKLKKPWLVDFRDACSLYNVCKSPIIRFLDRKIDKILMKQADSIITVGPYLAETMEKFYKRPIKIIYHGFDALPNEESKKRNEIFSKKEKIIYYAGRFHTHRLSSVKLLIDWLAQNKENNLHFVIRSIGPFQSNKEILNCAKKKNVLHKINLLASAPPEVILKEEKEADILVLFEDLGELGPVSKGTMTGKLFEYLPFQAPILAIARTDSDIGIILKDTSHGYLVSNTKQLDEAMEKILSYQSPNPDWEKVKKYSREEQTKKLCSLLDEIYLKQK